MNRIVSCFAIVVTALGAFGCSSSSSDSTAPVTADSAAAAVGTAYCARFQACAPVVFATAYTDVASCAATTKAGLLLDLMAAGTSDTPATLNACASSVSAISCADLFDGKLGSACAPKPGTVADGGACGDNAQCTSAFCKLDAEATTCGKCTAAPAEGDACVGGLCPGGLSCGGDNKCHSPGASGAKCDTMAGAGCSATLSCSGGTCVAPGAVGADCDSVLASTKTKPACDGLTNLWCNTVSNKCEPAKTGAASGAACGIDLTTGSLTQCDPSSFCQVPKENLSAMPPSYVGTCMPKVADGAACPTEGLQIGNRCQAPDNCIDGTCKKVDPTLCK